MEGAEGMVAVVRGLQDSSLAVTLYDNGKQYTLAPNSYINTTSTNQSISQPVVHMEGLQNQMDQIPYHNDVQNNMNLPIPHVQNCQGIQGWQNNQGMQGRQNNQSIPAWHNNQGIQGWQNQGIQGRQNVRNMPQLRSASTDVGLDRMKDGKCNFGVQAVDGRYASVYQTTVGKLNPTSPPVLLPEFPAQRPGPSMRGNDNFVVGGTGSGDTTYNSVRCQNSFRGGLIWDSRGSVCSPRPSRQPDAFASSLRKYPRLSPDRSSEIVERLINYTQAKNFGLRDSTTTNRKVQTRNSFSFDEERRTRSPSQIRGFEGKLRSNEGSPIRTYDVFYMRDMSKAPRQKCSPSKLPRCTSARERNETVPATRRSTPDNIVPNMVNSESQAGRTVFCREGSTVSSAKGMTAKSNVAISSSCDPVPEQGGVFVSRSTQTAQKSFSFAQTTLSCINIPSASLLPEVQKSLSHGEITAVDLEEDFIDCLAHNLRQYKNKKDSLNSVKSTKHGSKSEKNTSFWHISCGENYRAFHRKFPKDLFKSMRFFDRNVNVYHSEVTSFISYNDNVRKIVSSWLDGIPLQSHDFLGRSVKKNQILSYIVCRIKIIPHRIRLSKKRFRSELLDIIDDIPIDVNLGSKAIYLNMIVEDLINKLESPPTKLCNEKYQRKRHYDDEYVVNTASVNLRRLVYPTKEMIRDFVQCELLDSLQTSKLDLDASKVEAIETDLVDVITENIENILSGRGEVAANEIVTVLKDTGQLLKGQAKNFANLLLQNIKKTFEHSISNEGTTSSNKEPNKRHRADNTERKAVSNKTCETEVVELTDEVCCTSDKLLNGFLEVNVMTNAEKYKWQLSKVVGEWLDTIQDQIEELKDPTSRQIVVNDLTVDIIDRRRYIELNHGRHSDKEELENLRYQIFKWINRLGGDKNVKTLEKTPELMKKIRSIPVPILCKHSKKRWAINTNKTPITIFEQKNDGTESPKRSNISPDGSDVTNVLKNLKYFTEDNIDFPCKLQKFSKPLLGMSMFSDKLNSIRNQTLLDPFIMTMQGYAETSQIAGPSTAPVRAPRTIDVLNAEFLNYVKEWVKIIPLPPELTPDIDEKVREGLLVGVFRAIAKIKSSPAIMLNQFYLEDVLDDEIEELFSNIPDTAEFLSKKHILKVRLIEKTSEINELLKQAYAPETYAEQLQGKVSVYIPRTTTKTDNENLVKLFEELKVLNLTEEYILFMRYKDEDPVKANVYKIKLMKSIQLFVDELKNTFKAELKDINPDLYMNEILAAMQQVPLPTNETIRREADEILLRIEVDKWFADLPIAQNPDPVEQLKRRRLRDQLAKKLHEMEKTNSQNESQDRNFRHEISKVIDRLPLNQYESKNIDAMVDELANRIRNRQKAGQGGYSPQAAGQNQFVGGQPLTSTVTATRIIKDVEGRLWYSYDEPNQGPGTNKFQSLPAGYTIPRSAAPTREAIPQNLQNAVRGPEGLRYVVEAKSAASPRAFQEQQSPRQYLADSAAAQVSQQDPGSTFFISGLVREQVPPYNPAQNSMAFEQSATMQDPTQMRSFAPPLSSTMYQPHAPSGQTADPIQTQGQHPPDTSLPWPLMSQNAATHHKKLEAGTVPQYMTNNPPAQQSGPWLTLEETRIPPGGFSNIANLQQPSGFGPNAPQQAGSPGLGMNSPPLAESGPWLSLEETRWKPPEMLGSVVNPEAFSPQHVAPERRTAPGISVAIPPQLVPANKSIWPQPPVTPMVTANEGVTPWLTDAMKRYGNAHFSIAYDPQTGQVMDPASYEAFSQGRPRSSSIYQQVPGQMVQNMPQDRRVSIAPHAVVVSHDAHQVSQGPRISIVPVAGQTGQQLTGRNVSQIPGPSQQLIPQQIAGTRVGASSGIHEAFDVTLGEGSPSVLSGDTGAGVSPRTSQVCIGALAGAGRVSIGIGTGTSLVQPGASGLRSQGTQNTRNTSDDSDLNCRCLEKIRKKYKGKKCHKYDHADIACPYRYFPPPPCYFQ